MSEYVSSKNSVDKKLMKLVLDCPHLLASVMLTGHQRDILGAIRDTGEYSVSSRWLADELGKSIQSSSGQLTKLWQKGYLIRREIISQTGGKEYLYKSVFTRTTTRG